MIAAGAVVIGVQSFYATLGGKLPVIGGVAPLRIDGQQKNTAVLFGDATSVLGPMGTYGQDVLHAKTAAVTLPQTPRRHTPGALATEAALKAAGITVKMGPYPENATDLTGVLASTGARHGRHGHPVAVAAPDCVNIGEGVHRSRASPTRRRSSPPRCASTARSRRASAVTSPSGPTSIASSLFGDTTDPGMLEYMKLAQTYSTPANAPDPWNIVDFGQMMTIDKILNQVGYANLSPARSSRRRKAFKGPQALGAPALECGYIPGRARRLQQPLAVLRVRRQEQVGQDGRLAPAGRAG